MSMPPLRSMISGVPSHPLQSESSASDLQAAALETGVADETVRQLHFSRRLSSSHVFAAVMTFAAMGALASFFARCDGAGRQLSFQCVAPDAANVGGPAEATSDIVVPLAFVPNSVDHPPPVYRIVADSPYDAGLRHGRIARERILGWFDSDEMQTLFMWSAGAGKEMFSKLKRDNSAEFPDYAEEMRGIADGAVVTVDQVWCANMINDLENLMKVATTPKTFTWVQKGCSDIYSVAEAGFRQGFVHGHNDDWSDVAKQFWYILSVAPAPGATQVDACAGVVYPATLVGWAPTWNGHGIYATQNTLTPNTSRPTGLACALVQRRAVCGARTMDDAIDELTKGGWSDGASMNLIDLRGQRMVNIELWEDLYSVHEVTAATGNYSHFNEYKHLTFPDGRPLDDPSSFRYDLRQSTVDAMEAPRTAADVAMRLSDPRVFSKNNTLVTLILDGISGRMNIWCCGVTAASQPSNPVYSFNLHEFF